VRQDLVRKRVLEDSVEIVELILKLLLLLLRKVLNCVVISSVGKWLLHVDVLWVRVPLVDVLDLLVLVIEVDPVLSVLLLEEVLNKL
jgi:hypothetical protein